MSMDMNQLIDAIKVSNDDIKFIDDPKGFGWAPTNHLRAQIAHINRDIKVVIKRCYTYETFKVEKYLYEKILSRMLIRTPKLYKDFQYEGDYWLILEDIGEEYLDVGKLDERKLLLQTMGSFHGEGINYIDDDDVKTVLPHFESNEEEFRSKRNLLVNATKIDKFNLDSKLIIFFEYIWDKMSEQTFTLLHGDTDPSNFIIENNEAGVIDFEKAKIGPVSLDLSKIASSIHDEDLEYYHNSFSRYDNSLSLDKIREMVKLGEAYNNFHWICYDLKADSEPPYPEYRWNEERFIKMVSRLHELINYFEDME